MDAAVRSPQPQPSASLCADVVDIRIRTVDIHVDERRSDGVIVRRPHGAIR